MNTATKGAAKRLIISLLATTVLGGCAVYESPQDYQYGAYPANRYGPGYYDAYGPEIGFGFGFEREVRHHDGRHEGRDEGRHHGDHDGGHGEHDRHDR